MDFNVKLNTVDPEIFPFQESNVDDEGNIVWDDPVIDPSTNEPVAKVGIRLMGPFFEERIAARKFVVDRVYNPKTRAMDRDRHPVDLTFEETMQERDDAYDYAITFLSGFKGNGVVLTCTRENKLALMKNEKFSRFFSKCQAALSNSGIEMEKTEKKILPTLSSGLTPIIPEL